MDALFSWPGALLLSVIEIIVFFWLFRSNKKVSNQPEIFYEDDYDWDGWDDEPKDPDSPEIGYYIGTWPSEADDRSELVGCGSRRDNS